MWWAALTVTAFAREKPIKKVMVATTIVGASLIQYTLHVPLPLRFRHMEGHLVGYPGATDGARHGDCY
jgi:hypothetical protein